MKDDELERVLAGLDSALAIFRRHEGSLQVGDIKIQATVASLRHELALYRAVARTARRSSQQSS